MTYFSKPIFLFFGLLFCHFQITGQVYLSEVVSKNKISLEVDNQSPDWIEIVNTSNNPVELNGYYLSDDKDQPTKWAFPNYTLPPNTYLIILADGTDQVTDYLHANFKISSSGEEIILTNPSIDFIEQINVPPLETDVSFAKIGGIWITAIPSPNLSNDGFDLPRLAPPNFSFKSGIYQNEVNLQLTHENPNVELIYFENDLTIPITINAAQQSLELKESTIICAQAVGEGRPPSTLSCESFIIGEAHDLPVLSLIVDSVRLFDEETGIFELGPNADAAWPFWGANFWSNEDAEVYFQYFNTADTTFYGHGDVQMHGGRESRTKPQKTFRLKAKNKYNQPFFEHPFFSFKPEINSYKRLVVRNASGDFNAGHCRDGFLEDYLLRAGLNLDANSFEPMVVYINGDYYGVMGLREKIDEYYVQSNYQTIDIDLLEEEILLEFGDTAAFIEHYGFLLREDLSDPVKYEQAKGYFDVLNLTDYFIAQIGNVSTAWPQNNIKFWRPKTPDGKWRYLLFDMDIALGRHAWTLASENALFNKMTSFGDTNVFINTINAFLDNPEFRTYFFNRHQDLFNTVLGTETMEIAFDRHIAKIEKEMPAQFEKWPISNFSTWESVEQDKIRTFIRERGFHAMQHYDDFFGLGGIYELELDANYPDLATFELNSLTALDSEFRGQYFKTVPISVTANKIEDRYFSHWEIEQNGITTERSENPINHSFDSDTKLTAIYAEEQPLFSAAIIAINNQTIQLNIISPSENPIQLEWIDVLGRQLSESTLTEVEIGSNVINVPAAQSTTGIIFLNLRQGEEVYTVKVFSR